MNMWTFNKKKKYESRGLEDPKIFRIWLSSCYLVCLYLLVQTHIIHCMYIRLVWFKISFHAIRFPFLHDKMNFLLFLVSIKWKSSSFRCNRGFLRVWSSVIFAFSVYVFSLIFIILFSVTSIPYSMLLVDENKVM